MLIRVLFLQKKRINPSGANKNILLINWCGKLGDAVISSFFIKRAKQSGYSVFVVTKRDLVDLYQRHYGVDGLVLIKSLSYIGLWLISRKITPNLIIPPFGNLPNRDLFFLSLFPRANFVSDDIRLKGVATHFFSRKKIVQIYMELLSVLGIPMQKVHYIIPRSPNRYECFQIIFNPFGSRADKSLSVEASVQVIHLIAMMFPNQKILLLTSPRTVEAATKILEKSKNTNVFFLKELQSYYQVFDLIYLARVVVSVDTSIVHIAYSLNKRLLVIYRSVRGYNPWIVAKKHGVEMIFLRKSLYKRDGFDILNDQKITAKLRVLKDE